MDTLRAWTRCLSVGAIVSTSDTWTTVVFCKTLASADEIRRLHHLELRQLGLNPNAAKSRVMTVEEFQLGRHKDLNLKLDRAKKNRDVAGIEMAALEWFELDPKSTNSWDKVAKKVYALARQLGAGALRSHAIKHAAEHPSVARTALRYLVAFDLTELGLPPFLTQPVA